MAVSRKMRERGRESRNRIKSVALRLPHGTPSRTIAAEAGYGKRYTEQVLVGLRRAGEIPPARIGRIPKPSRPMLDSEHAEAVELLGMVTALGRRMAPHHLRDEAESAGRLALVRAFAVHAPGPLTIHGRAWAMIRYAVRDVVWRSTRAVSFDHATLEDFEAAGRVTFLA
jgi:hypothetical protein